MRASPKSRERVIRARRRKVALLLERVRSAQWRAMREACEA